MIEFTREAWSALTPKQMARIKKMIEGNKSIFKLSIQKGGFDLPEGYLAFRQDYHNGTSIYGGISPIGEVST